MNWITDIPAALAAIAGYLITHAQEADAKARAALGQAAANTSPVDQIVNTGELLYALGAAGTEETRTLGAQLIEFATRYGWHGLGSDGRGAGIIAALRRDLGHDAPPSGWPTATDDPEPRADLVAAITPATAATATP